MLKKCLKHEWKACWKNMALLNGAAIFMGALGGSGFLFSQISELPDLLIVLYLFAYVLIVIAASVMTQVLMIQRYYKNLFTDEGYLTNVLPVSATDHILSKMLVFGAWSILNALSVLASFAFFLLFYAAISIGSLVSSHKILTAVLSYIGMTTVIQIFGGISIVRVFQDSTPTAVVTTSSVSTLIITVVLCVVLFLICRYILSRRLNLS